MRQCKDKGHISHPQEKPQSTSTGGGEGGQDGYITLGGGWGWGLPNLDHIYGGFSVGISAAVCKGLEHRKHVDDHVFPERRVEGRFLGAVSLSSMTSLA